MQNNKEELRDKIAKILVKWGMPTRQVSISEIEELFTSALAEYKGGLVKKCERKRKNIMEVKTTTLESNSAKEFGYFLLEDIITLITQDGK